MSSANFWSDFFQKTKTYVEKGRSSQKKAPLRKVAVTGSIASGKTTVCRIFQELGAYFVNADQIVHQLISPKTTQGKEVIKLLGREILVGERIDRQKIAEKVFKDRQLLDRLEKILFPAVKQEIDTEYQRASSQGDYPFFVAEVPLLFEADFVKNFDCSVVVLIDPEVAKERFLVRGGTIDQYEARNSRFLPEEERRKRATFVIENNGTEEELRKKATALFLEIREVEKN